MQKEKLEFWPCGTVQYAAVSEPSRLYLCVYKHFEYTENLGVVERWAHNLYSESNFKAVAREFRVEGPKGDISILDPWMDG